VNFLPQSIPEVILIEPTVYRDERGYFLETYHLEKYHENGISETFVQDNQSFSKRNVLRGLHAQIHHPQGKLVRVVGGEIFDVAVDIRPDSPTFRKSVSAVLSGDNHHQLWVPPGFAHGFCVLSESAHMQYKCTTLYRPDDEITIAWNDPELGIGWPVENPILNEKDRTAPRLAEILHRLSG
jgi:dTDP-4-dehydrorhamnose 3,5-epimerase